MSRYKNILTDERGTAQLRIGVITLNRPKQLNALNDALMDELSAALERYDLDETIGCIIITGGDPCICCWGRHRGDGEVGFHGGPQGRADLAKLGNAA